MMIDENDLDPLEMLKISQEKGAQCMKAFLEVIGEKRNGSDGLNMTPINTVIVSNLAMNMMQIVISTLSHPELLKTYKEQTLSLLNEYFDTQEQKLKSTMN